MAAIWIRPGLLASKSLFGPHPQSYCRGDIRVEVLKEAAVLWQCAPCDSGILAENSEEYAAEGCAEATLVLGCGLTLPFKSHQVHMRPSGPESTQCRCLFLPPQQKCQA